MRPHLGVVPLLQRFQVLLLPRGPRLRNQLVQAVVDDGQLGVEGALAWEEVLGKGQIPVGQVKRGAVLGLLEHAIHRLGWQMVGWLKPGHEKKKAAGPLAPCVCLPVEAIRLSRDSLAC